MRNFISTGSGRKVFFPFPSPGYFILSLALVWSVSSRAQPAPDAGSSKSLGADQPARAEAPANQPPASEQTAQDEAAATPSSITATALSQSAGSAGAAPKGDHTQPTPPKAGEKTSGDISLKPAPRPAAVVTEPQYRRERVRVKPREMCARNCPMAVDPGGEPPLNPKARIGVDIGLTSSGSNWWLSPLLSGWFPLAEMLAVSVDWGFAFLANGPIPQDSERFAAGNPFIAIHSMRRHGCSELHLGLGVTLPYASNLDVLYGGPLGMRGMWNPWLWTVGSPSIVIPISWETVLSDAWFWGGEFSLALAAGAGENGGFRVDYVWLPLALFAGYRAGVFSAGLRLQEVWMPIRDDQSQFAVIPFVNLRFGRGYLSARFTVNLDEPYGPSFKRDTYWGLQIGGGVYF